MKRPTKDQRIQALFNALVEISAQTEGYDEYSKIGYLHKIAHDATCGHATQHDVVAGACLLAAAPDLLAELREILWWATKENAPLRQQEIASIRAAIAKATGGAS